MALHQTPRQRFAGWPVTFCGAALLMGMQGSAAHAHAIESTLERLSDARQSLELSSRFGSGEPAAGAMVALVAPDGTSLDLGRTDAQGQLRFSLPPSVDASWELRVDQGPGHRDYLELPAGSEPGSTRASVNVQLRPRLVAAVHWTAGPLLLLGALVCWPRRRGA